MSDTSQGEGWWLASDGKWYPPELHRDYVPPAPPPLPLPSIPTPPSPAGPSQPEGNQATAWYKRRWVHVTGGALVSLVVVSALFSDDAEQPDQVTVAEQSTVAATTSPTAEPSPAPSPTPEPEPTAEPTSEPTPTPSATPTPAFEALDLAPATVSQAREDLASLGTVETYGAPFGYVRFDYQGEGWSDLDGDCISTRHEVLAAESLDPVTWSADGCFVDSGRWLDAWTGEEITDPSDATIDHIVALSHAHEAGAWEWDSDTKQRFTNDPHSRVLNIVSQSTNSAKNGAGPSSWRPTDRAYWCAYAVDWTITKARWQLTSTAAEKSALDEMLSSCADDGSVGPRFERPVDGPAADPDPPIVIATPTPVPATPTPVPAEVAPSCDPNYSGACVPVYPPDVNCGDISARRFQVVGRDVHGFDGDGDGVACES